MALRFLFTSLILLVLAACNSNPLEVIISRCPAVAVVGDAGTITRFKGDGREQEDITLTATIANITTQCNESDDVNARVTFDVLARTGPSFTGDSVTLEYFVAVLKDNSQLISKKRYTTTLYFDRAGNADSRQVIEAYVPTIEQARRYNYEVLLGFQATPDEVYFNLIR